jgi:hypothetical protein
MARRVPPPARPLRFDSKNRRDWDEMAARRQHRRVLVERSHRVGYSSIWRGPSCRVDLGGHGDKGCA